jgi:hypothetical protein
MGLGPGDAVRTDRDLSQWNQHTRLMYPVETAVLDNSHYAGAAVTVLPGPVTQAEARAADLALAAAAARYGPSGLSQ